MYKGLCVLGMLIHTNNAFIEFICVREKQSLSKVSGFMCGV